MSKRLEKETVDAILDAMDRGKKRETIVTFFDIAPTTADAIRVFRNYVIQKNHTAVARAIKRRGMIGESTKTAIMEHYGYELPAGFLEQAESEPESTPEQMELTAIPQVDYSAFLTGIMSQLAQLGSMPGTANDIGKLLITISQQMDTMVKLTAKQIEKQETIVANQNAQIQRMDQLQEQVKYMTRLMKNR